MVLVESNAMSIKATATTFLFGFKDDIVIRVTPTGTSSTVDIRSLSRVGGSDIGANAARIRNFRRRLLEAATSGYQWLTGHRQFACCKVSPEMKAAPFPAFVLCAAFSKG